jgi:hypothetical protein
MITYLTVIYCCFREMAGVVSSEGVFENDLSFSLTPNEDTESLQDLIDSELALRSQEPIEEPAPKAVESFSTEFLVAERNHSELINGNKAEEEEEQLLVDLSSEAPLSPELEEVAAPSQDPVPPSPPVPETAKTLSLDNENFFSFDAENNEAKPGVDSTEPLVPVITESEEPPPEPLTPPQSALIEEPPSPRVLEMNLHNLNLSAVETIETIETNGVHLTTNEDSWTTVEEAARDMLDGSSPVTETITYTNYVSTPFTFGKPRYQLLGRDRPCIHLDDPAPLFVQLALYCVQREPVVL